jgi:hypothetical protein
VAIVIIAAALRIRAFTTRGATVADMTPIGRADTDIRRRPAVERQNRSILGNHPSVALSPGIPSAIGDNAGIALASIRGVTAIPMWPVATRLRAGD